MSPTVTTSELTNKDLIQIRALVIQHRVALEMWSQVVSDLVPSSPTDELRIEFLLRKEHDYAKAVLDTLRIWQEYTQGQIPDLVKVLRQHRLNALAVAIENEFESTETPVPWLTPPTWFEVGEVVPNFTGREAELKTLHERLTGPRRDDSSAANLVAMCGLGGVGKSALARKYAYMQREFYGGNVIWINAESVDSMRLSFRRLAKRIGVEIPEPANQDEQVLESPSTTPSEETPQETLLTAAVYERFNDRKCLFIFDNVEEHDHFQLFQPKIVDPSLSTPYVLLTSRKTDLTQLPENRLNLGVISMEDTIQLVQKQLKESTVGAARSLAEKLQSYPLALQQALAYIGHELGDDDDAILEYVQEFDESAREFLNDEKFIDHCKDYTWTTLTTWKITLKRICGMEHGESATQLINTLSYLNPDRISVEFLTKILERRTRPGLSLLKRFSMIDVARGLVTIHRLVQKVVRLNQDSDENGVEVGRKTVIVLVGVLLRELENGKLRFSDFLRECVSHGLQLFPPKLSDPTFLEESMPYFHCLVEVRKYLHAYQDYAELLSPIQEAASAYESVLGQDNFFALTMKLHLADNQRLLKHYRFAVETLKDILATCEAKKDDDGPTYLAANGLLAKTYSEMGDHDTALEIFNKLLPVLAHQSGDMSSQFRNYMSDKAHALRRAGRLSEALEVFERLHSGLVQVIGEDFVDTWLCKRSIARLYYYNMGWSEKGVQIMREVYETLKEGLGENHPRTRNVSLDLKRMLENREGK